MDIRAYLPYMDETTMTGPNSLRMLDELWEHYPQQWTQEDRILNLGFGNTLSSLALAKETEAQVYANDLWFSAEDNRERFLGWGAGDRITVVSEDAYDPHYEEHYFDALVCVNAYHTFAGRKGFIQEKILPYMNDHGLVMIGVPGIKQAYAGQATELLEQWLGEDAYLFRSAEEWRELVGDDPRMESVEVWEMDCFGEAWWDWLDIKSVFSQFDREFYEYFIQPYTCLIGICIRLN